ncbi:hypothetical protein c7_L1244 [Megavirus courdo7]|uniref:Uncharacterized protein n=1 Tax=Megavirus courdo7 TaxID=1128135 RepID=H2ECG8_9VIRU|nr:hypothetical protein c7_L1244 [Megavirus courdo7]
MIIFAKKINISFKYLFKNNIKY